MTLLDYLIIAVVAALFILALIVYRKKPRCSCGCSGGCSGNCAVCGHCTGKTGTGTDAGRSAS